jgi:cell wall-associated NlpC family hydrolase
MASASCRSSRAPRSLVRVLAGGVIVLAIGLVDLLGVPGVPGVLGVLGGGARAAAAPADPAPRTAGWRWPLDKPAPEVIRHFHPPPQRWAAGHRGVDLAAAPGEPVLAPVGGEITFAGRVAGRGVVVVAARRLRATLEPVTSVVRVRQNIEAGELIGHLETAGSHCLPATCLHWGVRRGETYLDPLTLLPSRPADIVLLPLSAPVRSLVSAFTPQFPSDLAPSVSGGAGAAIAFARRQLGDPYVWAATGPDAWDCSGLTMAAWAAAGRAIPRTSVAQQAATTPIAQSELAPGDLVFWSVLPGFPSTVFHVGLYIGDGLMIHAPRPGTTVRVESIHAWARPTFFGRVS